MASGNKTTITISATINAPVEKVWLFWTTPEHIMRWNNASDDWHTPSAVNDLRPGGSFTSTMAAKDGSMSFDFTGIYDTVETHQKIAYTLGDDRTVMVLFEAHGQTTTVTESFDTEDVNAAEMQRAGWQAILDNFKKYVENN